jgi:hypothetical protein
MSVEEISDEKLKYFDFTQLSQEGISKIMNVLSSEK